MAQTLVEPNEATAAPAVEVEPTSPQPAKSPAEAPSAAQAEAQASKLPDDLLKLPAFQGLIAGAPPAVSANLATFSKLPEAKLIAANKDALMKAGIGLYKSLGGDLGVLFNQFYITPDELKVADSEGRLPEVAPPYEAVNQQIATAGEAHPALNHKGPPEQFKQPMPPTPPQAATVSGGLPAGAQKALTTARAKNQSPGQPTEGAVPGGGRLLNAVLKSPL